MYISYVSAQVRSCVLPTHLTSGIHRLICRRISARLLFLFFPEANFHLFHSDRELNTSLRTRSQRICSMNKWMRNYFGNRKRIWHEQRLKTFENGGLWSLFGNKMVGIKVDGERCVIRSLPNFIFNRYHCCDQIEANEMGGTCQLHLGMKNIYKT
jgi:hypothetical protein